MIKTYDIVIVGSGLSTVTCLKYINKQNNKLKVGVITGYRKKKLKLSNFKKNFIQNNHNKISQIINDDEIDISVLKSSIKYKTNIFSTKNKGGLSAFWGGGYYPDKVKNKKEISKISFIKNNFCIYKKSECEELKINNLIANKLKLKNSSLTELNARFLISSGINSFKKDLSIYNPYEDIKNLQIENKNVEVINEETIKIKYEKKSDSIRIYNTNSKTLKTKKLLLCAGVINTPKILYDSGYLKTKDIKIKDHKLYRVPLFNPISLVRLIARRFFLIKQKNSSFENSLSSLVQSYKVSFLNNDIFLGIYFFPKNYFKLNKILKWLANNKIIVFSQLYHSDPNHIDMININIANDDLCHKITNNSKLTFLNKIKILKIFIKLFLFPIPYKYSQDFGSSYHLYGSMADLNFANFKIPKKFYSKLKIADSSTIKYIGCEPTSFKVMVNALCRVKELID